MTTTFQHAQQLPEYATIINTIIMFSVLVYETTGPIFSKLAIKLAGELYGLDTYQEQEECELINNNLQNAQKGSYTLTIITVLSIQATMIDSQGMGRTIVNSEYMNISLFSSLRKLLNEQHSYSKTIFSVVSTDIVDNLVNAIKDIFAEKKPGVGFMFTLPVNNIYLLDK